MVRGKGSARVDTGIKASASPNAIRVTLLRGRSRDFLDDLITMTINVGDQIFIALSRQSTRASASNRGNRADRLSASGFEMS